MLANRFVRGNVAGMAIKSIIVSDISNQDVQEDQHARVIIKHPDYSSPLEIDVSVDEAGKFVETTLRLVEFTIYEPNKPPRTAVMETKMLDKVYPNFDDVLQGARKASTSEAPRRGRKPGTAAPKGDRVNYTDPDKFGQLHRGRITDEEKQLVQANREQASKNREAQTGSPLDWNDSKEAKRYGL